MSVQTNFRAEDMLGGVKAVPVVPVAEAKKITGTASKKPAKVEAVVEAPVEVPVVEEIVAEAVAEEAPVEESAE